MGKLERINVVVGDFGPFPALADMSVNWNGFVAAPMFDKATAAEIVAAVNASSRPEYVVRMTIDNDGVWEWAEEYSGEYSDPRGQCFEWHDNGRVAIGAFAWTWLVE
jgi:hypothetical protein